MKKSLFCVFLITLFFQNCSNVGFDGQETGVQSNAVDEPIIPNVSDPGSAPAPTTINGGLAGGHFDLDTSSKVYNFSDGDTDHHIHEYDDKHNVNFVDFFSMHDEKLGEIQELVDAGKKFILVIANAQLSPGAVLEINGQNQQALAYQLSAVRKVFTLGAASGAEERLSSLKIVFDKNAILNGGLIPTQTGCVVKNDAGAMGEYRNGALTIQAIDVEGGVIDANTGTASSGLLWEATLFFHKKDAGCYK